MQTKHLCVLSGLSPPVKYSSDRSKAVLLLWILYGCFFALCLLCLCMRLFIFALWSPAGNADLLPLVCGV